MGNKQAATLKSHNTGHTYAELVLPLGLALCLFLTALFFAKPMNRMGLITLPDFYRVKYGRTKEWVAAVLMVVSFSLLLAGNL